MRPPKYKQSALKTPLNRILGTEANVRVLRAICLEPFPMSKSELGRLAKLEAKSAHIAADRLLREGVLKTVGRGIRQQVDLESKHPLTRQIQELFRAEQTRVETLLEDVRKAVRKLEPEIMAAWIQGNFARGEDRPGEPLIIGILANSKVLGTMTRELRNVLSEIEAIWDSTIELVGYTHPDLMTMKSADRRRLSDAIPLLGPPPEAFIHHSEGENPRLRDVVMHGDREKEQLLFVETIIQRILRDPGKLRAAKEYISKRLESASEHERHELREWESILKTMSPSRLRRFLLDTGERARRLRQTMPFLEIISPKEREEILDRMRRL